MLSSFLVSLQAVFPLFFMMMLGYIIRKRQWLTDLELNHFNGVIFKLLFPFLVFSSIHKSDLSTSFDAPLVAYSIGSILLIYFVSLFLVLRIEKDNASRGAMIQSMYRSNFVLLGLPLVANICGESDLGTTAILISILIPIYNILAVITLETFRGGRIQPKKIVRALATNPLILGCVAGILAMPLSLPAALELAISDLAAAATPIALLLLGASFQFKSSTRSMRNLSICVVTRLLVVPAIFLTIGALLGFRGLPFVTLFGVFAAPCAVSSFTMAQQMDSDAELAGDCVIFTSLFSCLTLFCWIFLFKQLGMF